MICISASAGIRSFIGNNGRIHYETDETIIANDTLKTICLDEYGYAYVKSGDFRVYLGKKISKEIWVKYNLTFK